MNVNSTATPVSNTTFSTTAARAKRLTQRQPLVCRACTKSKVRCDKTIPCSRCQKRQIPCEREEVELSSKRQKIALIDEEPEGSAVGIVKPTMVAGPSEYRVKQTVTSSSRDTTNTEHSDISVAPVDANSTSQKHGSRAAFENLATGIEGLAWGRHQCVQYPHRHCSRIETPSDQTLRGALSLNLLAELPDVQTARQLVDFHVRFLSWSHNVLHAPTFLRQCEAFWTSATVEDGQWLAGYCAVLSTSAWSILNCRKCPYDVDVVNFAPSTGSMFDLMMDILNSEQFMSRHTIFSIQAICISGLVGNIFGKSDLLTTLVNAAIRIAQCLGLHKIPDEEPGELWNDTLDREVGRRLWWKLVEMDYHSTPYTGSCSINARHFTTRLPLNCNDEDLVGHDASYLTTSTYSIIMAKMSLCIPKLLDGLSKSDDVASRYEHVISIDRQMRKVVTKIPSAILRDHGALGTGPEWLTLARRTLAITAADKILMIHRPFLLRSFQSPAYLFTRTTCISAAMTILREHEQLCESNFECPPIWVHSAFCVTAIVVICLHLLYCRSSMTSERRLHYEQLIRSAGTRLSLSKNDTMARRGVYLIDAMLDVELPKLTSRDQLIDDTTGKAEFVRILNRFLEQDQQDACTNAPVLSLDETQLAVENQLDDFDTWYHQMFG
ncbi:hypothetical protein FKW77_004632 [Venturia effusa]|uniref:Zn(2)-C6 fungal-type domain-containing protein n=1 Tax=Venturia effusa TaxID=50376 RepID=A0A517KZD4_9PEZI|nr:hypothetical protein FKW77_004632 [Venturia effusa]